MRQLPKRLTFCAVILFACLLADTGQPVAQADNAPAGDSAVQAAEHVQRARRLREFGFPLLARTQLEHAQKLDPTSKHMLIEYLRLYTHGVGDMQVHVRFAAALRELYPNDYEGCLELAWWLYWVEEAPTPPSIKDKETLQAALKRLDAEMVVYRALGKWIANPEGELPSQAGGKPALPLAYLARCIKAQPGSADAIHLASLDLERRGRDFFQWSSLFNTEHELGAAASKAFELAALEVYGLALPLFQAAARHDAYYISASVAAANLLFRMRRYDDAERALTTAEMAQPGNVTIAQTRLALAEVRADFEKLEAALLKLHAMYGDVQSELDVRAVRRIVAKEWDFGAWSAWTQLQFMQGIERTGAIRAMLAAFPDFTEVYFLDALHAFDFARMAPTPDEQVSFLHVVLKALDRAKDLETDFVDWHRLRADALWMMREYELAAASYERVAAMEPTDVEAIRHAAAARDIAAKLYSAHDYGLYRNQMDESGDLRAKREVLVEIVTRSPKFFHAQLLLGKVASILSDFETAYGAFAAAAELAFQNIEALQGVARAAQHTGRLGEALKYFEKLTAATPDDAGAVRMEGIMRWVMAGSRDRQQAFTLWLQSMSEAVEPTKRRNMLEEASLLEPEFAEVLVELAAIERATRREASDAYLTRALRCARDESTRAAAHRERGRLRLAQLRYKEAVAEFEAAFAASKGDGTDLLLAALAHRELGNQKDCSAAMRRLFAEVPNTPLLRPGLRDVETLGLEPIESDGLKEVHPAYDVGAKLSYRALMEVDSEGGGIPEQKLSLEYGITLEVIDKPLHSGFWRFKLKFTDVPPAFAGLERMEVNLRISPWFGLLDDVVVGEHSDVVNPVLQALAEAFTVGIGDAPIAPPYVWKNDLTVGPPRFAQAVEGSCILEELGDSIVVQRRAIAGRQLGLQGDDQHSYSRALEARVNLHGRSRAVHEVVFTTVKKELTKARDDVEYGRLYVRLTTR